MILDYICKDEDECLFEDMCSTESSCKNNVGSFECICNRGFRKQEKRHIVKLTLGRILYTGLYTGTLKYHF